jgi:ATP-dependent Clp protease ATP-binding subunit ClpC
VFERFTERARQVIVVAQDEARESLAPTISSEHILLGLLHETSTDTLAMLVLEGLGITYESVRDMIPALSEQVDLDEPIRGHLSMSVRAKKVLELALREALSLGHNYIGTEHILLGLVRDWEGVAAVILADSDVTPKTIRNEVIKALSGKRDESRSTLLLRHMDELADALAAATEAMSNLRRVLPR